MIESQWKCGMAAVVCVVAVACGGEQSNVSAQPPGGPSAIASAAPVPSSSAAAADGGAAAQPDDAEIARAGDKWLELIVDIAPESASTLGLHAGDGRLNDRTAEGYLRAADKEQAMLDELKSRFAHPRASRAELTDLALLEHSLEVDVRLRRDVRAFERQPDFYTQPMDAIFLMLARDYAPAGDRAKNALARLDAIPPMLEVAKKSLKNPPKVWTQVGIESADGAKSFFDDQRPILEAALPNDKAHVDASLKAAKEAYAAYKTWLQKELLPKSNGSYAAGKPLFEFLLHEDYFLSEGADDLLAVGKKVFDETKAQLVETAKKADPKAKSWRDVIAKAKLHHPTADDLLPAYRREVDRAKKFLVEKDAVAFPPGDDLQVLETPSFERTTIQAAYDEPPPFDAVTKGFFYVTPVEKSWSPARAEEWLRESSKGDQVDTVVHEAYPGHHLQLSLARLHPSRIRRATAPAIFEEGWALYCEELMNELGYYTDEERLFQLQWTLVRAARVILDVGLHTGGMTFDQGVKILTDDVGLEKALATNEVKRYTLQPTQPLAYLIGRERIFAMRDRYKAREKEAYSLKRFHTEVLSHGSLAPGLLEREIFGDP